MWLRQTLALSAIVFNPAIASADIDAASEGAIAEPNITITVDKYSVCRDVTNIVDHDLMVPARSPKEWYSFYANDPYSVNLQEGCLTKGYPAPLEKPDAMTFWDIYETMHLEYFTGISTKFNNTDLPDKFDNGENLKSVKYSGRDSKDPTALCKKTNGEDALTVVDPADYDYNTYYKIFASKDENTYLQFYQELAADVVAPEEKYCTIHVHYLDDDPKYEKLRALRVNYIIGAPSSVPSTPQYAYLYWSYILDSANFFSNEFTELWDKTPGKNGKAVSNYCRRPDGSDAYFDEEYSLYEDLMAAYPDTEDLGQKIYETYSEGAYIPYGKSSCEIVVHYEGVKDEGKKSSYVEDEFHFVAYKE